MVSWIPIATGVAGGAVVGVAGTIVGAWLTPWVSGRSQNEQARRADKRQVYATCLDSLEKMLRPIRDYRASPNDVKSKLALDAAADAMFVALLELKLIAPKEVRCCAEKVEHLFQDCIKDPRPAAPVPDVPPEYKDLRHDLLKAMRVSLGESAE